MPKATPIAELSLHELYTAPALHKAEEGEIYHVEVKAENETFTYSFEHNHHVDSGVIAECREASKTDGARYGDNKMIYMLIGALIQNRQPQRVSEGSWEAARNFIYLFFNIDDLCDDPEHSLPRDVAERVVESSVLDSMGVTAARQIVSETPFQLTEYVLPLIHALKGDPIPQTIAAWPESWLQVCRALAKFGGTIATSGCVNAEMFRTHFMAYLIAVGREQASIILSTTENEKQGPDAEVLYFRDRVLTGTVPMSIAFALSCFGDIGTCTCCDMTETFRVDEYIRLAALIMCLDNDLFSFGVERHQSNPRNYFTACLGHQKGKTQEEERKMIAQVANVAQVLTDYFMRVRRTQLESNTLPLHLDKIVLTFITRNVLFCSTTPRYKIVSKHLCDI